MKVSSKILLEFTNTGEDINVLGSPEELNYHRKCLIFGTHIMRRFKTGYVKCVGENMGWQRLSGYKVFECQTEGKYTTEVAEEFIRNVFPHTEWTARVYSLRNGRGLYINITHHDNPVNGDQLYLTPVSERTYKRLS